MRLAMSAEAAIVAVISLSSSTMVDANSSFFLSVLFLPGFIKNGLRLKNDVHEMPLIQDMIDGFIDEPADWVMEASRLFKRRFADIRWWGSDVISSVEFIFDTNEFVALGTKTFPGRGLGLASSNRPAAAAFWSSLKPLAVWLLVLRAWLEIDVPVEGLDRFILENVAIRYFFLHRHIIVRVIDECDSDVIEGYFIFPILVAGNCWEHELHNN